MMPYLSDDEPIKKQEADRLGHAPFARSLAIALSDWNKSASIVVALNGPWGSGKTSIVNMVAEQLESQNKGAMVRVLRFNPWNFRDGDKLVEQFFRELIHVLKPRSVAGREGQKAAKVATDRMELYEQITAGLLLLPHVGHYVERADGVLKSLKGASKALVSTLERTLVANRETLNKSFSELGQRVVVMVDDVDRLTPEEVALIVQLIKLNANFPYLTYLLAADLNRVADALTATTRTPGHEYLKKIVQAEYQVPAPTDEQLISVVLSGIGELLEVRREAALQIDPERWESYVDQIAKVLTSIREIKRYLNSAAFIMGRDDLRSIEPLDLLIIEAVRVAFPEVFARLTENIRLFTAIGGLSELKAILKQEANPRVDAALSLLELLFAKDSIDPPDGVTRLASLAGCELYFKTLGLVSQSSTVATDLDLARALTKAGSLGAYVRKGMADGVARTNALLGIMVRIWDENRKLPTDVLVELRRLLQSAFYRQDEVVLAVIKDRSLYIGAQVVGHLLAYRHPDERRDAVAVALQDVDAQFRTWRRHVLEVWVGRIEAEGVSGLVDDERRYIEGVIERGRLVRTGVR